MGRRFSRDLPGADDIAELDAFIDQFNALIGKARHQNSGAMRTDSVRSPVAQWQSGRLVTDWTLVRAQPEKRQTIDAGTATIVIAFRDLHERVLEVPMFLSIAMTHRPATDLGFLLMKHPDRAHETEFAAGKAVVFFPEATTERCEAVLTFDIDPIGLVRGRGDADGLLDQYVNDRPYAAVASTLRIIWGPECDAPENLERLRGRGLGGKRR